MIKKAVIPAAGLGTRLLPATKEQPKEMLPLFALGPSNELLLKPVLHLIFEQLLKAGFMEFCFIVGRGKRAIEDYFTPDSNYIAMLMQKGKINEAKILESFYKSLKHATLLYINQPEPKGFGDAVLKAKSFVGEEKFLVQAGDTYILSKNNEYLKRLIKAMEELNADAMLLIQKRLNIKGYGVVEAKALNSSIYKVEKAVEKPEKPLSNLAILPIYIFKPVIFKALETIKPGVGGELQLTDAIQALIDMGKNVYAIELGKNEERLDVGTLETYWEALCISYNYIKNFNQLYSFNND